MFKKIILLAVVSLTMFTPVFVSAQGLKDAGKILSQTADPSKTGLQGDLGSSIATIIKTVLALVGTIFLILTIYAGVLWMTAQGEESKVEKAKEIIKASIIGLIIIMSAYAITAFVTAKLGGATGASNSATSQTGCCFAPSYVVCQQNVVQSSCNTTPPDNLLWQAGSCPSGCAGTI